MKRLALLRHAKSSWDEPGLDDFDRPLNERGWKAARRVGGEIGRRRMRFDLVLASPAARVRETIDGLQEKFDLDAPIRFEQQIYAASEGTLLELVRRLPDNIGAPLCVGHNPGLEQLILRLATSDQKGFRDRIAGKYPTAALAVIALPFKRWKDVEPGGGEVVELILPKELD